MNPKSSSWLAPCTALVLAGCASASPGSRELIGTASVAITSAPADGTCIQVQVTGYRTVTQSFDVAPGATTVLALDGLPLGTDTFTANAFGTACAMVNPMSVPNWVSVAPVTQTVAVSPPASIALVMERNGNASVSIDFPDEPDGSTGTPPGCMPPQVSCGGACLDTSSDPANCGRCGHDCQGGACSAGACQPVTLSTPGGGAFIAIDAANIYWSTFGAGGTPTGTVTQLPLGGGMPITLAAGQTNASDLTSDGTSVYFLAGESMTSVGSVFKVPVGGGPITTVSANTANEASGIAVDATSVYWFEGTSVMKAPKDGGTATRLALNADFSMFFNELTINATSVFWTSRSSGGGVFGSVWSVPIGGGAVTNLATNLVGTDGIAVDDQNVYWANAGSNGTDGTVMKEPLGGGAITVLASGQCASSDVAVDGTNVYWVNLGCPNGPGGTVMSVPRDGGTPVVLATGSPLRLKVDATSVYWTGGGVVQKVAKP
jgi:hypothetical protein